MIWIALHGVMFLFLFSDFYKQSYNKRAQRLAAKDQNGQLKAAYADHNGSSNQGACMVSKLIFI